MLKSIRPGIVEDWIRNDKYGGFQYYKPDDDYEKIVENMIPKVIKRVVV